MSACLSSPIALLAARGGPVHDLAQSRAEDLVAPDLLVALSAVPDPRKARGVRHRLVTVLAAAVCAVLAGARSYVAIAEWAQDLPVSVRLRLGIGRRAPSESTFRRVLRCLDAQALDQIVSGWLAERAARQPVDGRPVGEVGIRAIAVDGKTARGAGGPDRTATHLFAAFDHRSGVVLGQTQVGAKTNEITAFAPLLDRIDITGTIITADALHTQDRHADYLHERGAHSVFIVKNNRPTLRAQLAGLPWRDIPAADITYDKGHGRVESRALTLTTLGSRIALPYAELAAQITRRRRATGEGWHTETVYAVTDLGFGDIRSDQLAEIIREHWSIEVRREVALSE